MSLVPVKNSMAHDRFAKKQAREDCPDCGGSLHRKTLKRVPGGTDYEKFECTNCDWSQRY